jgi:hypothetical protein
MKFTVSHGLIRARWRSERFWFHVPRRPCSSADLPPFVSGCVSKLAAPNWSTVSAVPVRDIQMGSGVRWGVCGTWGFGGGSVTG